LALRQPPAFAGEGVGNQGVGISGLKVENPLGDIDFTNLRQFAICALLAPPNLGRFATT
jgi:hypothetical protein